MRELPNLLRDQLRPYGTFVSRFPDELPNYQMMEVLAPVADWYMQAGQTFADQFKMGIGKITARFGYLAEELPDLEALGDVPLNDVAHAIHGIAKGDVDMTIEALSGVLASVGSALGSVPFLNIFTGLAEFGYEIGTWAKTQIDAFERPDEMRAIAYARGTDQSEANAALEFLNTNNWGKLFLPPVIPSGSPADWGSHIRGRADPIRRVRVRFTDKQSGQMLYVPGSTGVAGVVELGMGFVPGTPRVMRMLQWENAGIDSWRQAMTHKVNAWHDRTKVWPTSYEAFRPSLNQTASIAWQRLNKPSRELYMLDCTDAAFRWDAYWQAWEWFVSKATSRDKKLRGVALRCLMPQWWEGPDSRGKTKRSDWSDITDPDGNRRARLTIRGITAAEIRSLEQRQRAYLDTLVVAYLDGSEQALTQNENLRSLWEQRRRQLLHHPAAHRVDLEQVPDRGYRQQLFQNRLGLVDPGKRDDVPDQGPEGTPFLPVTPGPLPEPPPPSRPLPDSTGGGGAGLAAVAAFVLGALALRT